MSTKICSSCKEEKSLDNFYLRNKQKPGQYVATCKACTVKLNYTYRDQKQAKAYKVEYHKTYKTKKWERDLRKLYNLTVDQYEAKLAEQKELCAICQQPESSKDKRSGKIRALAVDHCHKTNKIRGLLCSKCNLFLGLINDNLAILRSAGEYLVKYE